MKYVIIGNSAAAVGCIEGIRLEDKQGEIVVISSEPHHTYARPLISYLLLGKTDENRMKYRPDDFYKTNGCTTIFGATVEKIDADTKNVVLTDGTQVSYDQLLVATGSRSFVPPIGGLDTVQKKFNFMTLDDAKALDSAINSDSRVLIMGAGLIGLKCAEGILHKVKSLTVVDLADHILPSILDKDGSAMVQSHLEKLGVSFILGDAVSEFSGNTATLKSGSKVDFDVLVIAVGVRPNTNLISDIGGNVGRGIIIDDCCRTSVKDIFAAGDCTESYDISCDQSRILAILPNAYMQGICAGKTMTGHEQKFENAIPMNAIGFLGLHVLTAGSYDGEVYTDIKDGTYKKLFYKDDLLKGFIIIGDVSRAGIYTSLIRNKTPLSSVDFELIKEKPQLMAFSKSERKKMLAK